MVSREGRQGMRPLPGDWNGDGVVSQEEMETYKAIRLLFNAIDVSRDGFITKEEFEHAFCDGARRDALATVLDALGVTWQASDES